MTSPSLHSLSSFTAIPWKYDGPAAWWFITLPPAVAEQVRAVQVPKRGWGSRRVRVQIQSCIWETSIFPDTQRKSFLLPLKSAIRRTLDLTTKDRVEVHLTLL